MGIFKPYQVKSQYSCFDKSSEAPYTISRSKIERFIECPRCFWLECVHGISRPDIAPYTLNNAVDELFKREFDIHRAKQSLHPLLEKYGVDAVPFQDARMEEWRDALKRGIKVHDKKRNLVVRGGIDDVWINPKGELIIVDYKATAGKDIVTLDNAWKIAYKRQVEVYQWLFRGNAFAVSNTAYFVYANGDDDKEAFDGKLEFDVTLLPYEGDDSWIDPTLDKLKACLESDTIPETGKMCDYCPYREHAGKLLLSVHTKK